MARGSKAGVRRGRYSDSESATPTDDRGALRRAKLEDLIERVRSESPLKHAGARELGVRAVRTLAFELERLRAQSATGKITVEEAKLVSSVSSNLRRWFETLGVVELLDPDDEEGL